MNKIIGVGALNENTRIFYENALKEILGNKFTIKSYNFKEYHGDKLDVDILLISTPIMINTVKKFIPIDTDLILMVRTFTRKAYNILATIPKGTSAILVNNGMDTTFETMSLIYSLGFEFELHPYYPGLEENKHIKVAITTNEEKLVPNHVDKIYNIGHMTFSINTIVEILSKLDLEEDLKDEILYEYQKRIIPEETGVNTLISNHTFVKTYMNTILDLTNDGVIKIDNLGKIVEINKKAECLLELNEKDIIAKDISEVLNITLDSMDEMSEIQDKLLKHKKEIFIVNLKPIKVFNEKIGNIIMLENITKLRKLEERVRKEISIKGYQAKYTFKTIVGESKRIIETKELAKKMALSDASILIFGDTGTGKELFAQSIHNYSNRKSFPFIAINCAALPENLIESELFGYEEGAFTGAKKGGKAGVFEEAHLGTLLLDEIGDLQLSMQARLLRVLQEREVVRVGSNKTIKVDVRIISATNQDLYQRASQGDFRWDLYYRLNIFPLSIPSLKDRVEDIEILFKVFMEKFSPGKQIDNDVIKTLKSHTWKGNVRELKNVAKYLSEMGCDPIVIEDLPYTFSIGTQDNEIFDKIELEIINIIYEHMIEKEKIGRKKISEILEDRDIYLSEQEVRTILMDLSHRNYVSIGVGRQGTRLTKEAIKLIK